MSNRNPLNMGREDFIRSANRSKTRVEVLQKADELKLDSLSVDGKSYVFVPSVEFATHWLVLHPGVYATPPKPILYPLVWLEAEACHAVFDEKKGKLFHLPKDGLSQYVVVEDTLLWYAYAEKLWHDQWVHSEAFKTMMRQSFEATRRTDREDE